MYSAEQSITWSKPEHTVIHDSWEEKLCSECGCRVIYHHQDEYTLEGKLLRRVYISHSECFCNIQPGFKKMTSYDTVSL